jgi:hypothetical protein
MYVHIYSVTTGFTCDGPDAAAGLVGVAAGSSWALALVVPGQIVAVAEARIAYPRVLALIYIC